MASRQPRSLFATMVASLLLVHVLLFSSAWAAFTPPTTSSDRPAQLQFSSQNGTARQGSVLATARQLVAKGQRAMAILNEDIVNNPSPNIYEVLNSTALEEARRPAPLLDYESDQALVRRRRQANNGTSSKQPRSYRVPEELVEAARLLAEATPFEIDDGADLREKHASVRASRPAGKHDTHAMSPMLKRPNGLQTEVIKDPPEVFRFGSNNTAAAARVGNYSAEAGVRLRKRQAVDEDWWMASIQQRGESPYAPSGYKVWRNVKDYGALGNGRADDTAAINRAISDGGRCGDGCSGSTVYPATVYFPPGDYVVSSSIIQYYNTEILGDPLDEPRIIAAPSFVGLGVITTNVFREDGTEWYLNSNNVLRSIRNMIIDIRYAPSYAYVCGLHWQVARGTSLENVAFWQEWTMDTTQQGIYTENGNGGVLTDLFFYGGAFGAYMGSQQFTANGLFFQNHHQAGLQVHWDYGWSMNDVQWYNVRIGVKLTGGRGGYLGSDQAVGAFMITDALGQHMNDAITTTLVSENATSFLLQNAVFSNVGRIVVDDHSETTLLEGGDGVYGLTVVDSWGFGRVTDPSGDAEFAAGDDVYAPQRHASLTYPAWIEYLPNDVFFNRRRPRYASLGHSQLLDVRELGAKGDGMTDDTAVLNHIFSAAANMSAVVYVPYGVYLVKDTVEIPVGSRVIGQAWPQIMGTGAKFGNVSDPRPVVKVGRAGNRGVIEMQSLLFTVRGPAPGAVLLEWNVHQTFQGSAALWDCHFRAGGAEGSELQAESCSHQTGAAVTEECIAAALMLHVTQGASAYLENVWVWTADHDIDDPGQSQLDIYTGRGILIESGGPTWLWGVSAEHSTLYQFQISRASNILLGLVQAQTPFFQPDTTSIEAFRDQMGAFNNDPTFDDCEGGTSDNCAAAWGARVLDSRSIYMLSVNLYTWFQNYDAACIDSGRHDCQQKTFFAEQSTDVWLFNLVTIGAVEMVSPLDGTATLAALNRAANYVTASIMAWLGGADRVTGPREFDGYRVHSSTEIALRGLSEACGAALGALVNCDDHTSSFRDPAYRGALNNQTLVNSVCTPSCKQSVNQWVNTVGTLCGDATWDNGASVEYLGASIQAGIEEQCHKESDSGRYCNDIIDGFTDIEEISELPREELCSECYIGRLRMMQASPYSVYRTARFYQEALKHAVDVCGLQGQPTSPQPPAIPPRPRPEIWCQSEITYTTVEGDTCDSIAMEYSVSSASIFYGNPDILECSNVLAGVDVCMPSECLIYELQPGDDCVSIHANTGTEMLELMVNNPWITHDCGNLHTANYTLGNVLCLSIPGGVHDGESENPNLDPAYNQYTAKAVDPPTEAVVAEGTTLRCGRWHVATPEDNCATITGRWITAELFRQVNPSLEQGEGAGSCSSMIEAGRAYCTGPTSYWNSLEYDHSVDATYFGCFTPAKDDGTLVLRSEWVEDDERMAVKPCGTYCSALGFTFFGVRNGDTCLCDNRLNMDVVPVDASECGAVCSGDADGEDACGGVTGVSVYSYQEDLYRRYAEVGCFPETVFGGGEPVEIGDDMERHRCSQLCLGNHVYFGLARGNECHCGDDIENTDAGDSKSCDESCAGDALEMCGGQSFMTVWSTNSHEASEE